MAAVRAQQTMWIGDRIIHEGDVFDAKDPVVKGREAVFEDVETRVEAATAAPGEKRARKPSAKSKG